AVRRDAARRGGGGPGSVTDRDHRVRADRAGRDRGAGQARRDARRRTRQRGRRPARPGQDTRRRAALRQGDDRPVSLRVTRPLCPEDTAMTTRSPFLALVLVLIMLTGLGGALAPAAAQSQMTWAVHVTIAPTWFDPGEHSGIITIMMVLYAMHDALVKPMPGNQMAPSLAASWTMAKDGLSYGFALPHGL